MHKLLILEDEMELSQIMKKALEKDGYQVTVWESAAKKQISDFENFDLILLDIMMPEIDGFTVMKKIREKLDIPILFATAKVLDQDIVEGFRLGADDYIKKPFSLVELRARVSAHLRRENREKHQFIRDDTYSFDISERVVTGIVEGEEKKISLTKSEYDISLHLFRHKGQVFTLESILESVFGYDSESNEGAIRVHIKNIRDKFGEIQLDPIKTVWGVGYKWR
ncbi:response regulator transcription factor [Gallicola sp. Sow4_E12]|uniref:response regulator transcription factor n=1 Tax=Gallicola sp. Sow4_E12 TaxID=3438785 RepID=UPI003F92583F